MTPASTGANDNGAGLSRVIVPNEITEAVFAYASAQFDVGRASVLLEGPNAREVDKRELDRVAIKTQAELFETI